MYDRILFKGVLLFLPVVRFVRMRLKKLEIPRLFVNVAIIHEFIVIHDIIIIDYYHISVSFTDYKRSLTRCSVVHDQVVHIFLSIVLLIFLTIA